MSGSCLVDEMISEISKVVRSGCTVCDVSGPVSVSRAGYPSAAPRGLGVEAVGEGTASAAGSTRVARIRGPRSAGPVNSVSARVWCGVVSLSAIARGQGIRGSSIGQACKYQASKTINFLCTNCSPSCRGGLSARCARSANKLAIRDWPADFSNSRWYSSPWTTRP